jgi:hypothetical protein
MLLASRAHTAHAHEGYEQQQVFAVMSLQIIQDRLNPLHIRRDLCIHLSKKVDEVRDRAPSIALHPALACCLP